MRKGIRRILVTGGAGFIGSEFVRRIFRGPGPKALSLIVVDKLTYAGDLRRLKEAGGRYVFYRADIRDIRKIDSIFRKERPQAVVNFAAETHVDRSIKDPAVFIETNVKGVQVLLESSRRHGVRRFLQISTDEVYGELMCGSFREDSPLKPNSPYAASKASADLLINAYVRTYGFPALIVRPSNNYGPWQYPEKLIPLSIMNILRNKHIPIYAKGLNVREWLAVSDCAEAIILILRKGRTGGIYNVGSGQEKRNIDVAKAILKASDKPASLISFVKDRAGHDYRYSLDSSRVRKLGWRPKTEFNEGIVDTVRWCENNLNWLKSKA